MSPAILSIIPATDAALIGAPSFAFTAEDGLLVALLVGLGVAIGMVASAAATRLLRRRRAAGQRRDEAPVRRQVRRSRAGMSEDPIVMALGISQDEDVRARRRQRPIGAGLHTPPGDSPPPT